MSLSEHEWQVSLQYRQSECERLFWELFILWKVICVANIICLFWHGTIKHQRTLTGLKSLSTYSDCILNIKSTFLDLPLSNICYYFAGKLAQCIWCSQIFHDLCNKNHYHNLSKELYFHTQVESIEHCSLRDCSFVLESSNSSCFVLLGLYLNEFEFADIM